jgi:hypothetical protein
MTQEIVVEETNGKVTGEERGALFLGEWRRKNLILLEGSLLYGLALEGPA